jgi:tetratricopeptide (TPR) repeat protein
MSHDCFISYASEDIRYAEELYRRLTTEKFKVWFDKARLKPGYDWHKEIEEHCENSLVILPVLTRRWKESAWTRYETYGAESVIPLVFEGGFEEVSTPPLRRFQAQALDFRHIDTSEDSWSQLLAAIRELQDQPQPEAKDRREVNIPYSANPCFVGREAQLDEIHEKLFLNPTTALTQGRAQAITALGGVGKTTLAREYAEKFWRCYRQIFWVNCRIGVEVEYARFFAVLFPERAKYDLKDEEKAKQVLYEFKRVDTPLRLLILDDAPDDSIEQWLPKPGNCHTIITSRFTSWSAGVEQTPVWILEKEPARKFLLKRTGRDRDGLKADDYKASEELAEKLGYLPLALEQAAAYIHEEGPLFGFRTYLGYLAKAEHERKLFAKKSSKGSTDYPDALFTTWRTTIDKLSPGARAILRLSACMAPTPIPFPMFIKSIHTIVEQAEALGPANAHGSSPPDELDLRDWKSELARYSMIRLNASSPGPDAVESFSVHGLVQRVEWLNQEDADRRNSLGRAVGMFNNYSPDPTHGPKSRATWDILLPHAESLSALEYEEKETGRVPDIGLLDHIASAFKERGWYDRAIPPVKKMCSINEESFGSEHPNTLRSLNNLAYLLELTGDYVQAELLYRRAMEAEERVLGPEHPDTLTTVNNLGCLLKLKGDFVQAEPLLRRALECRERVFGPEHPDTLSSVNNLALLIRGMGDYAQAEPLLRRALDSCERVSGPEHPDTLTSVNNLAELLFRRGDYSKAEPLYRRALDSCERVLGPEHPLTLTSVNNLGLLLDSTGEHAQAELLYRRALDSYERVLGPDHPLTLTSVNNLGLLLLHKRDHKQAEPLLRRALKYRARVLGPEHPATLTSLNNMASLLARKGDSARAEALYRKALASREKVLGPVHSDTLTSVNNLARFLESKGDYAQAEPLFRRALEGLVAISSAMGRRHPNLETCSASYAHCLAKMGFTKGYIIEKVSNLLNGFTSR